MIVSKRKKGKYAAKSKQTAHRTDDRICEVFFFSYIIFQFPPQTLFSVNKRATKNAKGRKYFNFLPILFIQYGANILIIEDSFCSRLCEQASWTLHFWFELKLIEPVVAESVTSVRFSDTNMIGLARTASHDIKLNPYRRSFRLEGFVIELSGDGITKLLLRCSLSESMRLSFSQYSQQ